MVAPTPEQKRQIESIIAMQQRPIKRIILSGGGAKGIVYPGAYRALLKSGILYEVTDVAGSSAGAITAALIAVGTPIEYIRHISITQNIGAFLGTRVKEQSKGAVRPLTKDGNELYNFINQQIAHALDTIDLQDLKTKIDLFEEPFDRTGRDLLACVKGTKEITFAQLNLLHRLYPKRFKNLTVTAVEHPSARLQQFDFKHTPNVPIVLACRASASLPVALKPIEIEIDGRKAIYVDGGLRNNLPTDLISDPEHYEETLAFAFGEGNKADIYFRTDRVEHAIHRSHWSEAIELNFLHAFYQDVISSIPSLPVSRNAFGNAVTRTLKQRGELPYAHPKYLSPDSAKKLKKYALEAAHDASSLANPSAEKLATVCWELIKKIKRPIYKPHKLEYLGQNIFPKYLLGLNMSVLTTDRKYEDFRRMRDHFSLRTVDLHVGPISTIDFKKATKLSRVMDAVGYADTMGHILNHDLAKNPHLEHYHEQVNHNFQIIYRALLVGMCKQPEKDDFLKLWVKEGAGNNQFEAIKSHVIKNPTSAVAFAFTRAIEFQDQLIDRDTLFKETYLEAFKRKLFAKSTSLGPTFFSSRSLENALQKNPDLIPSLDSVASKPRNSTRLNSIAHELQGLEGKVSVDLNNANLGL